MRNSVKELMHSINGYYLTSVIYQQSTFLLLCVVVYIFSVCHFMRYGVGQRSRLGTR
jgi:hypothetical protein